LKSQEFLHSAAPHLQATYFDTPIRHNLAYMALAFWADYKTRLTAVAFTEEMKRLVGKKTIHADDVSSYVETYRRLLAMEVTDWKFVLDKLIVFIKHKELRALIEAAVKTHLPKDDFASIEDGMRRIAGITNLAQVAPYSYFDEARIDERTVRRERESLVKTTGISTGIKRMDQVFPKGGWYRKELYTILAPPKRGKTMALMFFANAAAMQGFNVAIFTLEVSTEVYSDRLDAMNANIEIRQLPDHFREAATRLKGRRPDGNLFVFEYPTKRLDCNEIERQLRRLEIEHGTPADIVFVDYGDIMKPNRYMNDTLAEQASIYEDLRALAGVFDIPVVTASQVNRAGSDKAIIKGKDTSGTWEKIMVSDGIISLSATDAELKRGEMKIHFAECRNMESKTLKIKTAYNFGRFYSEFVEEVVEV